MVIHKIINEIPVVSWFNQEIDENFQPTGILSNPTSNYNWINNLSDINVITTRFIDDKFISVVNQYRSKIYLHIKISGFSKTEIEPNSQGLKEVFFGIKKLINSGFPQSKILVIIDPIILNLNGLKALELLLKLFTEFNDLRLRLIRFELLSRKDYEKLLKPLEKSNLYNLMKIDDRFYKEYFKLQYKYKTIISIDNGQEYLIGARELLAFGYSPIINGKRIISYKNYNRRQPILRRLD